MTTIPPLESHPFAPFAPAETRYLLIGTFPGRQLTQAPAGTLSADNWYYGTDPNSLWRLLEKIYSQALPTKAAKQALLTRLRMGITDVVGSARRRAQNNDDRNLEVVAFQSENLAGLLRSHQLEKLFFTSQLAQKWFNSLRNQLTQEYGVTAEQAGAAQEVLPSPSPRYLQFGHDTAEGRLSRYRQALPALA